MIYFATMTSERGKPVTKSGNEYISITFTNERRQKFDVKFTGETLEVMRYSNGETEVLHYMPHYICKHGNAKACCATCKWIDDNLSTKELCNCGMNAGFHEKQNNCKTEV